MPRNHAVYLMSNELKQQADAWVGNKFTKKYDLIRMKQNGQPSGKLSKVTNSTILYIYTHSAGLTGQVWLADSKVGAADLARHLRDEGLDRGHVEIKVFACYSAVNALGPADSFAKQLYDVMRAPPFSFERLVVYGYRGEVNPAGYATQKSAGLGPKQLPNSLTFQQWGDGHHRAKDNRVKYGDVPPGNPETW